MPAQDAAAPGLPLLAAALGLAMEDASATQARIGVAAAGLRAAIATRDADALAAAVDEERRALDQAEAAESAVRARGQDLAVALGIPATTGIPGLSGCLRRRGYRREAAALQARGQDLAARVESARNANAGNALLLRQAIALTTLALRQLTTGGGPAGYSPKGVAAAPTQYRVLDARA